MSVANLCPSDISMTFLKFFRQTSESCYEKYNDRYDNGSDLGLNNRDQGAEELRKARTGYLWNVILFLLL